MTLGTLLPILIIIWSVVYLIYLVDWLIVVFRGCAFQKVSSTSSDKSFWERMVSEDVKVVKIDPEIKYKLFQTSRNVLTRGNPVRNIFSAIAITCILILGALVAMVFGLGLWVWISNFDITSIPLWGQISLGVVSLSLIVVAIGYTRFKKIEKLAKLKHTLSN